MPRKKMSSLDKVLGRMGSLDSVNLTVLAQRLARERSLLEAVFNLLREGVLIIDAEGMILYANEAASRMTGLKEADLGTMTLWKLVPDLRESIEHELGGLEPDIPSVLRELEIRYPEPIFVRLYIVPFEEAEGDDQISPGEGLHWQRYAVILTDITEEKQSTEERIESERLRSLYLLAAGVAHELGNPLNSLTIHLQLIQRKLAKAGQGDFKVNQSLEICQGEVKRLDGIIRNFLGAIRLDPPDFQKVHLLELIEEVLKVLGEELNNRGIDVEVEWRPHLPLIPGDRNQLKQVFFNLFKNAMEAMGKGGRLTVGVKLSDSDLTLQIGDTGEGIAHENIRQVFHPYFTTKKGGHGLGLMIVQKILRSHQAQIGVESRVGVGTVISLSFPVQSTHPRLLSGGTPSEETPPAKKQAGRRMTKRAK